MLNIVIGVFENYIGLGNDNEAFVVSFTIGSNNPLFYTNPVNTSAPLGYSMV